MSLKIRRAKLTRIFGNRFDRETFIKTLTYMVTDKSEARRPKTEVIFNFGLPASYSRLPDYFS
jgi:hypothetical protein